MTVRDRNPMSDLRAEVTQLARRFGKHLGPDQIAAVLRRVAADLDAPEPDPVNTDAAAAAALTLRRIIDGGPS